MFGHPKNMQLMKPMFILAQLESGDLPRLQADS